MLWIDRDASETFETLIDRLEVGRTVSRWRKFCTLATDRTFWLVKRVHSRQPWNLRCVLSNRISRIFESFDVAPGRPRGLADTSLFAGYLLYTADD